MLVPIRIDWFKVIKCPKDYKTQMVFTYLEAGDGTI